MKKILALIIAATLLISIAAVSAFADEPSYKGRSITVTFESSENNDAYQAEIDAFCAKYGCDVDVEILSADAKEANNTLFLRAATGNLPDILKMSVGSLANNLDPENNIQDLADYPFIDNLVDGFKDAASGANGQIWAVPTNTANVAGVFYNKEVLKELNIELPKTWDEFIDTCLWIKENTDLEPISNPYDGGAGKQITYLASYFYIRQENENFVDQYVAREINLHDSTALMDALNKIYQQWELGIQNEDPLSTSLEDSAIAICEGKAAFVICRTNIMSIVETASPEHLNDIGFFPLPGKDADARGVAVWMPQGWYMSSDSQDPELALLFLEFMTTPEAVDAYCSQITPTGAFMLKGVDLPDTVSTAVIEAQEWASTSSTPVMEYYLPFKGANLPNILAMLGTGEITPEVAVEQIEADFELNAIQNGYWN